MSNNAKEEMTETNPTANTADEKEGNRVKGHKSFVLSGVPLSVLRRVRALKKLQMAEIDLDCKFHDRINQLEKEFKPHFDELNQKRKAIVTGEYEPKDEECDAPIIHGLSQKEHQMIEKRAPKEETGGGGIKGIPEFWHDVLLNCVVLDDMITPDDLEIFKYLTDISTELHNDDPGFTLAFHFDKNPHFTKRVLKKSYVLRNATDPELPLEYDGLMLHSIQAEPINWTRKRSPTGGWKRNVRGEVVRQADELCSFFEFFDPQLKVFSEGLDEAEQDDMECDFEIAMHIRDSVIPKAVLYLTDEIVQEDDEDLSLGSDDDNSSSDDDDDDDDVEMDGGGGEEKVGDKQPKEADDSMSGGGAK